MIDTIFIRNLTITFFCLFVSVANCQNGFTSFGGDIASNEGSVSYTIGQVSPNYALGINGNEQQGIQQPHELFIVANLETINSLTAEVYPNPTFNYINISIKEENIQQYIYKLKTIDGETINSNFINGGIYNLNMSNLPNAIYFIEIYKLDNQLLSKLFFKIIKI